MSKANTLGARTVRDTYFELVQRFPLRPIRSDAELKRAIAMMDWLIDRKELDQSERDYLDVLTDQIQRYESEERSMPTASDAELLEHLLEAKGVTQANVASETEIAESTISEVLRGKRRLTRGQIGKLAGYFHVAPGVFEFCE